MEQIRIYIENFVEWCGMNEESQYTWSLIILVAIIGLVAWLSYIVCYYALRPLILRITDKTKAQWDDVIFNLHTLRSMSRIVPAVVIWQMLPVAFERYPNTHEILNRATLIYITFMSMYLGLTMVNSLKHYESNHHPTLHQYFTTFCGVLKIIIIFIALIIMVSIAVKHSPLNLLAGLGATSAVLMLVFKDTITGLVAGIRLMSNNMIQKGDWIKVDKAGVNGIVEEISLTTVKVRNFDKTILTITPQTLVDDSFQNWRGMVQSDGRRVKRVIYFDFRSLHTISKEERERIVKKRYFAAKEITTKDINMTLFRRYVERYLANHPEVNAEMYCMVRQLEAGTTGLPVEFYFFLRNKEWVAYEHLLADIMDHIYTMAPDFGLTIYQQITEWPKA